MIYKFTLLIHLTGLILLGGSTFFSFINFQRTVKSPHYSINALTNNIVIVNLGFGLGMGLFLLSGATFVSLMPAVATQVWFRIKIGAVVLLIVNHFSMGRSSMRKLANNADQDIVIAGSQLKLFYILQFIILITILIMSAFKFS